MKTAITFSSMFSRLHLRKTETNQTRFTIQQHSKAEKKTLLFPVQLDWLGYLMMAQNSTNQSVNEG